MGKNNSLTKKTDRVFMSKNKQLREGKMMLSERNYAVLTLIKTWTT